MMAFKKIFNSDSPIVLGDSQTKKLFPPGFRYRIGGIIYTVKEDVTQEPAAPMREILLSDGKVEITPVETIIKDLKEHDCEVMEPDERFAKEEGSLLKVKKTTKKKTKKTKKKKNE